MWDLILAEETCCSFLDDGAGWGPAGGKETSHSECVSNGTAAHSGWTGDSVSTLPPSGRLVSLSDGGVWGSLC